MPNESFVSTLLIECIRHEKILNTVIKLFYRIDGLNIRRSEENIYRAIAFLIFFQLDSVQMELFRGFIDSVSMYQMNQVTIFFY